MLKGHGTRVQTSAGRMTPQGGPTVPDGFDDHRYRDLLPSLEGHFASLLARHKEAAGRTEWSYHQYVPLDVFRATERPSLSATPYLAVETALLTEVNLPWYKALALGMGFQLLLNDGGNGDLRTTFLQTPDGRGDINFGENVAPQISSEVEAFLASRGATFTPSSSKVFSTNNPDFDAWRTIVTAPQRVVAEGNGNILAFITWRIN